MEVPKRQKFLISALFFFCLLSLVSCSNLPRVEDIYQRVSTPEPPEIIGPHGQLSPKMTKSVLERLKKQAGPTDILARHIALVESVSGSPLVAGNKATLLIDGPATYAAMYKAIQNAKDHINFETFLFADDEVGRGFVNLLLQKQSEGVQVNLIYDNVGCSNTPASFFQRLRGGGVQALEFNPINPLKVDKERFLTHRDHRKILIVDGSIAFTGGVNISGVYSSSRSIEHREKNINKAWRDTHVQIEGPAVAEFQKLFLDTWAREKGPDLAKRNYFPTLKQQGNDLVEVVASTPGQKNRITYIMYVAAFVYAEKFIYLTNAYFVPDEQTVEALTDAARRGVDVRIILPATSNEPAAFYAGRSYYTRLLKSGVKLYERRSSI